MNTLGDYVIVEFVETSEVATILKTWLINETQCFWPSSFNRRLLTMREEPKSTWDLWKVRILSSYDELKTALLKERRAQKNSDLVIESEFEGKLRGKGYKQKKKPLRIMNSSESSGNDSDLPHPKKMRTVDHPRYRSFQPLDSMTPPRIFPQPRTFGFTTSTPQLASTSEMPTRLGQDSEMSKLKDQLNRLERCMIQVKYNQEEMLKIMVSLLQTVQGKSKQVIEDHTLEINSLQRKLPCKKIEEFLDIEESLDDEDKERITAAFFKEVGGFDLEDHIRRILVRLVTDEVAIQFSWEGRRGKIKLVDMAFINLMKCVMSSVYNGTYTDKKFESKVKEWFRQASTRVSQKCKK